MSRKCEICGKGQVSGNNVSHSNRHTRRKWNANIQSVRVDDNGTVRKAKVCTSMHQIRQGKPCHLRWILTLTKVGVMFLHKTLDNQDV